MTVAVGAKLGPYEILAPIGKGGMGEVWKARDTKLGRDVALKILPPAFASDPDRMARFEREARVLASLDHPNIAAIYGLEETDGVRALVLALVEGPTLADRIAAGPIPLDEAIQIARQIADAVEYAHERGVIHRDLKPANIKLTLGGMVKVLDFGLAKALDDEPVAASATNSPTLTMNATRAGVLLGTAAYMSPEQAKGKQADRRSDIWAFGAVLYEMLTGKALFGGETVGDILASVIKEEPKLEAVPAEVRGLVGRCLNKDPRQRLQAIAEARIALENPAPPALAKTPPTQRNRSVLWIITTCVLTIMLAAVSWIAWRTTRPIERPLLRLSVDLGAEAIVGPRITAAISPDGTRIAFPIRGAGGAQMLAARLLDQSTPTVLSGTENGADPFFSPDSQWIGFFADGKLKKISVLGGVVLAVCDAPSGRGASWGEDGNIIATLNSNPGTGLSRVLAAGGAPQTLTKPHDRGEAAHRWPKILPGGKAVLFAGSGITTNWSDANIEALSLKTGEIKILVRGGYFPSYIPTSDGAGYLIYIHDGVLLGVAFDPVHLELRGTPAPLLEDIAGNAATGGGQYDVSRSGGLVYLSGKSSAPSWSMVWLESSGKTQPLLAKPGLYFTPRVSPDGNRLALAVNVPRGRDIYVYDWQHDTMPRLTFTGQSNNLPVWTPDGKHIAYVASDGLWWVRADGAGEPRRLLESKNLIYGNNFSPDGKLFAYTESNPETGNDLWTLPLDLSDPEHPKTGKPEIFLRTSANDSFGTFSPDAHWMAYASDESGQPEVYVRPFPGPGGKWQISTSGGSVPVWSSDGRELFYVTPDGRIMVTDYTVKGDSFSYVKPRLWADTHIDASTGNRYFDLHPDGKRFAIIPRPEASTQRQGNVHVTFLLNLADELRRRVPVTK